MKLKKCNHAFTEWLDTRSKKYPNKIRTTCGQCGAFIGYRPIPKETTPRTLHRAKD